MCIANLYVTWYLYTSSSIRAKRDIQSVSMNLGYGNIVSNLQEAAKLPRSGRI